VEEHPEDLVAIRYHGWWPGPNDPFYTYNPSENGARINYYSQNAVPNLHIDGIIDAGSQANQWWQSIQARHSVIAPLEISLGGEYDEIAREGNLNVDMTATEVINYINLRIRIALTESGIFFQAPNGLQWHNQVLRDIIPYPYGIPIDIEFGETISIDEPFSCPEPLVTENCDLVVWVQSDATAEVLQATRIELDELSPTDIRDGSSELPRLSRLEQNYPNPFNAHTVISFDLPNTQQVNLDIYDISGRLVQTLINESCGSGTHSIAFDASGLANGIYMYRLRAEHVDITKRMILIK
jgi:hypothetical protein